MYKRVSTGPDSPLGDRTVLTDLVSRFPGMKRMRVAGRDRSSVETSSSYLDKVVLCLPVAAARLGLRCADNADCLATCGLRPGER